MSRPHLRPHFHLVVEATKAKVAQRLEARFKEGGETWAGHLVGDHAQLVIRRRRRNIWSPWLTFTLVEETDLTHLAGRFAPHPSGWTLYLASYGIIGILMLGLGLFGLSQRMAGLHPTALWSLPVGALLLLLLYLSAFAGQRLSAPEMDRMRSFIEGAFRDLAHRWAEDEELPSALSRSLE